MGEFELNAVHIPCEDLASMEAFYTEKLGLSLGDPLQPLDDGPTEPWVGLKTGSTTLVLKPRGGYDGSSRPRGSASVHIAFHVQTPDEVDDRYRGLVGKSVEFLVEPRDWPWQERACFFHDPEGNLVEIYGPAQK